MGPVKICTGQVGPHMIDGESDYTVAVIIPTLNGALWLDDLLTGLHGQTRVPDEILVVDSGSTDATCDIARSHDVRLVTIHPRDFDHGGTRTMAAGMTQADILVYMTQDAIPADRFSLERLLEPFVDNVYVAAAYGRQLPNKDATLTSAHLRLFNYPATSELRCWKDRGQYGFKTIFISNSFAAYKREILAGHGFFQKRLLFGEDTLAVAKMVENGYCVAYAGKACVYHSHNYTMWQDWKRYFDVGVLHCREKEQLSKFGGPGGAGRRFVLSEMAFIMARKKSFLLLDSLLRNAGKLLAYNLGKRYKIIPRCWAERLSMNRNWWSTYTK